MGTRGFLGILKNKEMKGMYNHFDSYPTGLGECIVRDINRIDIDKRIDVLNDTYDYIQLVEYDDKPTKEQQEECQKAGVIDLTVSEQSLDDWYCLLRKTQMNFNIYINKKVPYMLADNDFINDEVYCEWAYVINLDNNKLEVYRYGNTYPTAVFDLLNVIEENMAELEKRIYEDDE